MVFSNVDEELEKLNKIKEMVEEINFLEAEKMFLGVKDIMHIFECSERRAREFLNLDGLNVVKLGHDPKVNIFVLNEFTQQRIVMAEIKK